MHLFLIKVLNDVNKMARESYTKLYALEFSLVQIPDYDNYFVKVSGKRCFGIKIQTKDKIYTIEFLF